MESGEVTGTRHVYAISDDRVGVIRLFGSSVDSKEK